MSIVKVISCHVAYSISVVQLFSVAGHIGAIFEFISRECEREKQHFSFERRVLFFFHGNLQTCHRNILFLLNK